MKINKKVVIIETSSWVGLSFGAEHYYAKMWYEKDGKDERTKLERPISQKEADYLNEKDGWHGWSAGYLTERFNEKDEIYVSAEKFLKENNIEWDIIIDGSFSIVEPQEIVKLNKDCNVDINKLNTLYRLFDKLEWTRGGNTPNDKAKDRLNNEWFELINQ